jgi:hypothetical protein
MPRRVAARCRALAEVITAPAHLDDSQLVDLVGEVIFVLADQSGVQLAGKSRPSIDQPGCSGDHVRQATARVGGRPPVLPHPPAAPLPRHPPWKVIPAVSLTVLSSGKWRLETPRSHRSGWPNRCHGRYLGMLRLVFLDRPGDRLVAIGNPGLVVAGVLPPHRQSHARAAGRPTVAPPQAAEYMASD